ncbi:recombinase family protein [Blautia producta]|uniref:recombinase family protein n=1 Tax=Blautia producta TaxID=33035 RepID=UPI0035BE85B5
MGERVFGYARVSSKEQNLDRQILALEKYVKTENILVDKASGKDLERSAYQALKGALGLRRGDTLYITSLDRLSRSKADTKRELQWMKDKGIRLKILDLPTSLVEIPEGQQWIIEMIQNILIEVLSSIAEQERLTIRKRQREGIEAAKKKGKHLGRPPLAEPDNFKEVYREWKAGRITAKEAMKAVGMEKTSFYRKVKEFEQRAAAEIRENIEES